MDPNAGNPFAATYGLNGTTTNPADMGYPQVNLSGSVSDHRNGHGFQYPNTTPSTIRGKPSLLCR